VTSLYEYLRLHGDTDIYDATYDTETACAWVWAGPRPEADAAEDDRDEWTVDHWMQSGIQMVRCQYGGLNADLTGFARNNIALLSEIALRYNDEDHQVHGCDDDSLYNAVETLECLSCGNYTYRAYHYIAVRVRKYEPEAIA